MAVDCHDCYSCDFHCEDCLADETKEWFKTTINVFKDYKTDFEKYKLSLQKIAAFSLEKGVENVRFEMSGEGNPDLYPYRNEIIEFAYQLGMRPVYISSGSYMDDKLCHTLVKYGSYIRISLPGTSDASYKHYSGQTVFSLSDAIKLLQKLVHLREVYHRTDDLVIGVRCCLRPHMDRDIEQLSKTLIQEIGVDTFQIVRAIKNNSLSISEQDNIIPNSISEKLIQIGKEKQISIPNDLTTYYNMRATDDTFKEYYCFASELTPILYGNYLLPCTHTRMIKSVQTVGIDLSKENVQTSIRSTQNCQMCCAINDNMIFNKIYNVTKLLVESGKQVEFRCY